jgi:hypothetical protein
MQGDRILESHSQREPTGPQRILMCDPNLCEDRLLSAADDCRLVDYRALDAAHLDLGPFSVRWSRL